jgi:hypothetical protein
LPPCDRNSFGVAARPRPGKPGTGWSESTQCSGGPTLDVNSCNVSCVFRRSASWTALQASPTLRGRIGRRRALRRTFFGLAAGSAPAPRRSSDSESRSRRAASGASGVSRAPRNHEMDPRECSGRTFPASAPRNDAPSGARPPNRARHAACFVQAREGGSAALRGSAWIHDRAGALPPRREAPCRALRRLAASRSGRACSSTPRPRSR